MSHLENEYKKRFANEKLENDNFDSAGLWDDISNELVHTQSNSNGSLFGISWLNITLTGLSLISLILSFLFLNKENSPIQHNEQQEISLKDLRKDESEKNRKFVGRIETAETSNKDVPEQQSDEIKDEIVNYSSLTSEEREIKINSNTLINIPFSTNASDQYNSNQKSNEFYLSNQTTSHNNLNILSTSSKLDKTQPSFDQVLVNAKDFVNHSDPADICKKTLENLPILLTRIYFLKSTILDRYLHPISYTIKDQAPDETTNNKKWALTVFTGLNQTKLNFTSTTTQELAILKNETDKLNWGTSFGLLFDYKIKEHWVVSSGLETHQLWSKFEYQETKGIQVLKEDQLLTIWIDEVSGDTLNRTYGELNVNAQNIRNVLHYNSYRTLSIPLVFGYKKRTNKFNFGIKTGIVLGFTSAQSGRGLDINSEIIDFTKEDAIAPFKSINIGIRLDPSIGYLLSEKWGLYLSPQWTWSQNNSTEVDIKTGIHQFNFNLGLRYNLGH